MEKIAFIGTGVMGKQIITHLANSGYDITCYNRTIKKAEALKPLVKVATNIKDCIKDASIIFTIVGFPSDVKDVYEEILKSAKKETICVDMTTSSPALAKDIYTKAQNKNIKILDAPVTGGEIGAINKKLTMMVGGDYKTFKMMQPIFKLFCKTVLYMGSSGKGQSTKLANQIAIAGSLSGLAESISFAMEQKLDLHNVLKILNSGSAASFQIKTQGVNILNKNYEPGFYIKHFLKDLKLALSETNLDLVMLATVTKVYEWLVNVGYADKGTQGLIEYYLLNHQ